MVGGTEADHNEASLSIGATDPGIGGDKYTVSLRAVERATFQVSENPGALAWGLKHQTLFDLGLREECFPADGLLHIEFVNVLAQDTNVFRVNHPAHQRYRAIGFAFR